MTSNQRRGKVKKARSISLRSLTTSTASSSTSSETGHVKTLSIDVSDSKVEHKCKGGTYLYPKKQYVE